MKSVIWPAWACDCGKRGTYVPWHWLAGALDYRWHWLFCKVRTGAYRYMVAWQGREA